MVVITLRGACPMCQHDVSGNNTVHFLCGRCEILFDSRLLTIREQRRELVAAFEEYVTSADSQVYHVHGCKYAKRIEEQVLIGKAQTTRMRACKCVEVASVRT